MPVKPPKAPLARTRSGAEANSVHLRGQRVNGDAQAATDPIRVMRASRDADKVERSAGRKAIREPGGRRNGPAPPRLPRDQARACWVFGRSLRAFLGSCQRTHSRHIGLFAGTSCSNLIEISPEIWTTVVQNCPRAPEGRPLVAAARSAHQACSRPPRRRRSVSRLGGLDVACGGRASRIVGSRATHRTPARSGDRGRAGEVLTRVAVAKVSAGRSRGRGCPARAAALMRRPDEVGGRAAAARRAPGAGAGRRRCRRRRSAWPCSAQRRVHLLGVHEAAEQVETSRPTCHGSWCFGGPDRGRRQAGRPSLDLL